MRGRLRVPPVRVIDDGEPPPLGAAGMSGAFNIGIVAACARVRAILPSLSPFFGDTGTRVRRVAPSQQVYCAPLCCTRASNEPAGGCPWRLAFGSLQHASLSPPPPALRPSPTAATRRRRRGVFPLGLGRRHSASFLLAPASTHTRGRRRRPRLLCAVRQSGNSARARQLALHALVEARHVDDHALMRAAADRLALVAGLDAEGDGAALDAP